jgi:hypothetical protein
MEDLKMQNVPPEWLVQQQAMIHRAIMDLEEHRKSLSADRQYNIDKILTLLTNIPADKSES